MRKAAKALFLGLIVFAVLALIAFSLASLMTHQRYGLVSQEEALGESATVLILTDAGSTGKHLGDEISYAVEVLYDTDKVEIERQTLNQSIDFTPFTTREVHEKETQVLPNVKAYRLEYKLQLIDGKVNTAYAFPSITVRYLDKNSGRKDVARGAPVPIFISARLPQDARGFELKPMKGRAEEMGFPVHAPLFIVAGGLLIFSGIIMIGSGLWKARRLRSAERKKRIGFEDFFHLLQELSSEKAMRDPQGSARLLYQAVRTLLAQEEGINWLQPEGLWTLTSTKKRALSLMEKCGQAYDEYSVTDRETAEEFIEEFKKILESYYQKKGGV